MSNSLDSFLTRIGDVTIERVGPRSSTRNSNNSGGNDDIMMTSSGSNHGLHGANDDDSDDTGGDCSDNELEKRRIMMHCNERDDINSEGSGDDMDLDDTIDTEIGVRMDSERQNSVSSCQDDDVDAVNILDTLPLEGAPIEGQEVSEADLLGKPLKDDDSESVNSNPGHSDPEDENDPSKRRDSDDSDPAKKKQKKEDDDIESKAEKKLSNMRRNIREVMDETQLDEATLSAQRQEMERLRRVQEQQRIIREVQRQIANHRQANRGQSRVISLLQGKQNEIGTTLSHSPSGSSQIKSPNQLLMNMNSQQSSQQSSSMTQPGASRRPMSGMRWQKGRGGYQGQTMMSKVMNRAPAQNVLQQRIRMMTPSVSISPVVPKREPMDDLPPYYSDSDLSETEAEEIDKDIHGKFPMPKSPKPLKGKDVVTISSSSESSDDDCIVLSDPSGGEETDTEDDPSNSGMHTNDRYNIPDEHGRVLINVGHPDTEPDVFLAPQVARIIKPHQIGGLRFLFDNIVESIERYKSSSGFGCILAHSMGLGKTLQVTSFCDIFFRCTTAKTVLCIMPINTLQNWLAEFNMWLPYEDPDSVKPPEVPKKPEFDQKQDIKEESSNQTDISSLSSRSMSTDSRSHQEMPQHMGNMMGGGGVGGFPHQSYDNPGMGNFYPEMMNKPGMEQNYHQMYPNMPPVPNYPAMKQELDCGDGSTKPTPPNPYGTDNPGVQYPGQMYPGMDNRSMYPGINPQNPSYPRYQNPQYPNYPQQMPQDHIKSENKPEMGIKKEPEEPATKDEGTSTSKDETSEEKKDVEKINTPFSVDAPIGLELRPRHFRLHILNDSHKTMAARARVIKEWQKVGGVLLIGYELYRQLSLKKPNKGKRKRGQPFKDTVDVEEEDKNKGLLDEMHGALVNPGPDLVICDEGHRIKNSHASISLALKQMRTKRRIVLTGYPLQNNLLEYWCMVDFVRPNYLGTKAEFCNMFERPIQNGQCIDSTPQDIRLMRYRAHVLHALLEGFVQRRSHSVLQVSLPRKEEYIMLVRMTPHQRKLYDTFMNQVVKTRAVPNPLKAFAVCCKIWNHPDILYHFLRKRQANEEDDLDLEETIEKATPGNKRTKPRGRGEKRGRKVGTIKNKPAASVQPNSLSTGANENDNDTTGDTKSGNFPNFTQQIQPPNFPNSGQNYPQNYQEFRPNEPNNYYRNESTTGFNELYNNNSGNQQRFPNQQFPSYPQGGTNYPQQNYQQNQNQNFPPGEQSTQNTQQKYSNPQNPEFRSDQSNNTNYEMPGIFPRQSYNFQEQRNFQAPPNQPGNQQNYQNQIPNQSNVPISEFPNYPHNPPHNYPQTSANNPMFRSENQMNPHSFPAGQNQNQPQNPPAPSTGFINNQPTPAAHQAPAPLLPNAYPPSQQNPSSNFPQTPPTQGQIFQQNPQSQQNQQQHNYQSNNQSQMRNFQTPQAPFPAAQGHGFSSERQPYPAGQSCPPAGAQQQSYPGNQGQRYPGPQQNYNQNQNGPSNPPGNYGNSQTPMQNYPADGNQPNQFKGQEERFGWQGNYQQQVPEQWDQSQGNRYQGNYFNAQNYPQNYDYSGNPGEVQIKTEDNKGAPPPQPNMLRGPNPIGNYDSKKDVSVGIQSQPMPPANYVQPNPDGVPNPPRPLQNMNFNRNNAPDLPKDEDKDKDEILVEKDKEDKSDDEVLLKDEEKDPKNSPNFKEDPGIPYDWATELMKGYVPGLIDASAKMTLFFCILEEAIRLGDRVLAFSQSLFTLNLIEDFLARNDFKNPDGTTEQWMKNVNYYRLDGSTSALEREKLINEFNHNSRIHLFLVSTRAGSLGINLVGANRAIVFDASWNPCHDTQAVCRVYRYGQKKPCYVYRLVTDNCLERKIYDRQISKQGMADRVVDQCNPDAHLSLKEATTLSWDFEEDSQVQDFSSSKDSYTDEVMHTVLEKHSSLLTKQPFHHESLLVDRKDKKLSQAEKRLARRGYELEKMAANCSRPSYNYIPGNTATRAGGLQIRAIRGGDTGVAPKPVASVRPMQQRGAEGLGARGVVGSRWIPAEVWQRQGMSAQEMTLPLDVVIPTNSPDKSSIVLKAGQRVMVLKSPKGIYMQLESGKIIAIRTALKINQQKREEEPKKPATVTSPRAQKPDVSFPLRSNSAISIIPKTTATSAPPTPRPLSRPSSGSGYRQFPDKDPKRPKPVLPTPLSKGNMALPLTNQVTLQRHSRGKNEMDHSSAGENSNSSDSQPRIDQRVEEVRLEDIVGDGGGSNSDYSPTNSNRIPNNDVMSEDKSHDFGSDPMSSQKVIMQSVQTQHTETEPVEMLVTDGKERLGQPEMKDQLRPGTYGHRYPTQVIKDDSDEIIIEEPVRPIVQHQPVQHPQQQQQQSMPVQVIPRPSEMPKLPVPVPLDQQHPTAAVKERQAPNDASDGPEHGIPQAYPYAQYPRYYDYPDPRSRGLPAAAAPYGSYYPGGPAKAQPEVIKTEERNNYPQAASAAAPAPTAQVTQPAPAPAEPVEPVVKTENLPPTTTASVPTAFTHPPGSRYPGSYPPAPYDPYSQHYPAAPATNPAYPPSGTPGYGAYGGPSYNTDYARMYSAFHGPPPPVADPYMHRGYAPPPTTHTSNYYAPFPHPPPPPYPNYSFIPPYSNPNIPNESQPPAQ